ncbi:vitamin K epoxide reductase family protein [Ktedonobacter racemifer]|uniref:Vitamin K epoxide reductase n=1 Tax=Ktedonobacter racemifer DSM 44963 TaxID=485913 RepID=D6TLB7_KTERA|nr:vitamin K epoxide reductase family protein [Ktedonobacter racemifer]EFH86567.1 Vitamin K epoxide reductase [Ktedonobacter racemifer DSM 44963]
MTFARRSVAQIILLVLSVIGIGVSIYLTYVHYNSGALVCTTSGLVNCERVLSSMYSVVPGTSIPISVPGLLWFLVSGALAAVAWLARPALRLVRLAEFAWCCVGLLTVLYLVYVELVRLHTICAWCTSLHVIILVMLLITVVSLYNGEGNAYDDEEDEEVLPSKAASRR